MSLSCKNLRNVAVAGHNGTGKTTLAESILFHAGVIGKRESVESGKTVSDYTDEEISKKISVHTSFSFFKHGDVTVNMLDTPGTSDFVGECVCGFRSCESVVMLVDSKFGPQIETFKLWRRLDRRNKPRLVFINKMDKEDSDFNGVLAKLTEAYQSDFIVFSMPIVGSDGKYAGVYDFLHDKAYSFADGQKEKEIGIPEDLRAKRDEAYQKMIEKAAESDDALMERYFEDGTLSHEDVLKGLGACYSQNSFVPVMAGSASSGSGIAALLDFIADVAPNPDGKRDYKYDDKGERINAYISEKGPFSGYVFKTVIDQFSGKLSYVKVVTGTLFADTEFSSTLSSKKEKPGKLYKSIGKKLVEVPELVTGDIGVICKSQGLETNATLAYGAVDKTVYASLMFPSPTYSLALVVPKKQDEVKITEFLKRICAEDMTFRVEYNSETLETTIHGMGEVQIGMILDKIKDKLKISVQTKLPEIAYRETITKRVPLTEFTHKKQTGGHGQFARVVIDVEPLPRGGEYKFTNVIKGGAVSKGYVPGIEKGLHDALQEGVLAHYPMVDVSITLLDGKEHPVDSSEMAFRMAASGALKAALSKAGAVLLEPYSKVWIYVEESYMGDILSDISTRRGRVINDESLGGGMRKIYAEFPDASLRDYPIALKSITSGTASFDVEPSHYEILQGKLAEDVINARAKSQQQ